MIVVLVSAIVVLPVGCDVGARAGPALPGPAVRAVPDTLSLDAPDQKTLAYAWSSEASRSVRKSSQVRWPTACSGARLAPARTA
jgi:hypothetical protein